MLRKNGLFLLLSLMLIGCGSDSRVTEAEKLVRDKLKDGITAKFKQGKVVETIGVYICGQVNAKNSFGAYTGWSWYHVNYSTKKVTLKPSLDVGQSYIDAANTMHQTICN